MNSTAHPPSRSRMLWLCLWLLAALPFATQAHQAGLSYLNLTVESNRLSGRVDMALRDLDLVVGLDQDGNGSVTYRELVAKQPAIGGYVLKHLRFSAAGETGLLHVHDHLVATDADGAYAVAEIEVEFPHPFTSLDIHDDLFQEIDPGHRSLLSLYHDTNNFTAIFGQGKSDQTLKLSEPLPVAGLETFFREGVWHIWTGYDHILFLLALLLPAVLERRDGRWQPVAKLHPAFINVAKVVTAFTLAHSLTLGLAVSGIARLPSRFVESAIAASVAIAAINNIRPFLQGRGWVLAFAFGLIHGFGFASALNELNLQPTSFLTTLVGFNLGVEAGQMSIVAIFLPVAFNLRETTAYQRGLLLAGSAAITLLATFWLIERAFGLNLLG